MNSNLYTSAGSSSSATFVFNERNRAFLEGREPLPRGLVEKKAGWRKASFNIVFLALFCVVGLVFYYFGGVISQASAQSEAELNTYGVDGSAQIINKYQDTDSEGSIDYYIVYEYIANDAKHQDRQSIASASYRALSIGQAIPIRYSSRNPNLSRMGHGAVDNSAARDSFISVWNLISLGFSGVAGLLILFTLYNTAAAGDKRRELLNKGTRIAGKVLSVDTDSDGDTDVKGVFTAPDGATVKFTKRLGPTENRPRNGTEIAIHYLNKGTYEML